MLRFVLYVCFFICHSLVIITVKCSCLFNIKLIFINFFQTSISVLRAFILISQCPANKNSEHKNYVSNILKFDLANIKNENSNWKIIFTLIDTLKDDTHSHGMAGFPIFFQSTKWYNIDYKCLQSVLNLYIVSRP